MCIMGQEVTGKAIMSNKKTRKIGAARMTDKLLEIINHYGVMHQLKYFQSEVFELNEAIIIREQETSPSSYTDELEEYIAEEIADVCVMLLQFKEYYHIDGNDILEIMKYKIDRQMERLKNE